MKHFTSLCAALFVAAAPLTAAPLCPEFNSADAMPKKYKKLAPVISGAPTDWIFTVDHMDTDYVPGTKATDLLTAIVDEFEARDTKLAIMMAPPRPLVAGQAAVDGLTNGAADFDVAAVSASFQDMINAIRESGAIAPDLLSVATSTDELRDDYYYRHDTHWTPVGAAESAYALAVEVAGAGIAGFDAMNPARPTVDADATIFSEKGSLAGMAKDVCGVAIAAVEHPVPVFPSLTNDLLGDTSANPQIILAGSSFSNRYKKDAYRVADALAGSMQAEVINHSVSGGGAIGGIEGIVNADLLDGADTPELVIWELPYTEGMQTLSPLRQLLGALRHDETAAAAVSVGLENGGETRVKMASTDAALVSLHLPGASAQRVKVDLRYDDGSKETVTLVRKKHVPSHLRTDWWSLALNPAKDGIAKGLKSISVRYKDGELGNAPMMHVYGPTALN